jgi:ribonuclease HI
MELLACICVLKWIRENKPWSGVSRVQIFTDSQYVKENLFRAREWKKNGWRNQHGEPRENSDLWNDLLSAHSKAGITVHFEWTLGKKTPVLKRVDKAAKSAASRGGPDRDWGYKPGTIARSMVGGAASRFPANGQTALIRPYRKNILAKGEEKVRFDVFAEDTQTYVESCYAFTSSELAAELHRQHGYRVRFDYNSKYPQILEIIEEVPLPKSSSIP